MPDPAETRKGPPILAWIAAAVLLWGVFHAVGTWSIFRMMGPASLAPNPWRGVMVLAAVGVFLGFWGLLLLLRRRRVAAAGGSDEPAGQPAADR